jgi:hypothetical protein
VEIRRSEQDFGVKSQDRAGPVALNRNQNIKKLFVSALPLAEPLVGGNGGSATFQANEQATCDGEY